LPVESVAALLFALMCLLVIGFQLGLALGAPWGAAAMGGRYPGRFPASLRVAAVVQAVVLALVALVVLADAGVVGPLLDGDAPLLVWVAVAVSAISVILNAITRSVTERRLWLPVAVVMLLSSLVVAVS
jgi:hypothetical protein